MRIKQAVGLFMEHRNDKGLSVESLALYRYWLTLWQEWREKNRYAPDLAAITAEELRTFFRYLEKEHIPHSANPRRKAANRIGMSAASREGCWRLLRALWNFLAEEDLLERGQHGFFKRDRVPRPRVDEEIEAPKEVVDSGIVKALLKACGTPFDELAARNRAMILMLSESGMRVTELCKLDDGDVDLAERTASVRGKGKRRRFVFWGPDTATALGRYLLLRSGRDNGPLFRGHSSRNQGDRLTRDAVRGMIKRLAAGADITLPENAPVHGFRSGFAQRMLDDGIADLDLQQLLGHKDIRTTAIYARRHPRRLREVHRRVFGRPHTPGVIQRAKRKSQDS